MNEAQKIARNSRSDADAAQEHAHARFCEAWPVGGAVCWSRSGYFQLGFVTLHGYGDRVKVRNAVTGAEYWVSHGDVFRGYAK